MKTKSISRPPQAEQCSRLAQSITRGHQRHYRETWAAMSGELVAAAFARDNQPYLGGKRLTRRHRIGLALGALAPHSCAMPPDLSKNGKAVLVGPLRETIERARFPLLPLIERLPAARRKSTRATFR